MTRAEIIRRLRAGETGHGIDVAIAKLLLPKDVHVPPYTGSVDAALAAPIAEGWVISGVTRNSRGWFAEAEAGAGGVGAECGEAPTLAAAIMIAKLLTFNGGQG